MKNKVIFIVVCMILLCSVFKVCASESRYLVKFKEGFQPDIHKYDMQEVNAERGIYSADNLENIQSLKDYIEYTSENSEVFLIEGDEEASPFSLRGDAITSEFEQIKIINADAGWRAEAYGNDVKVAVIDSGCFAHEDLKNNLLEGKNYFTGSTDVTDNQGHGTHVSGIIAAEINGVGVAGVAPKAKIIPFKCFDPSQKTYVQDLLDAIYDAVDVYDCKVINMSWGVANNDPFLKKAIDYADSKGVIMVAAVGNYGSKTLYYPAAYDNVIGVTSVGESKTKSTFSQYNDSVTVAALGESVRSTYKNGNYTLLSGTSQASPMVAGVAAVALSIDGNLTSQRFRQLLTETAEDLGDSGYDVKYGYGLVNEDALINKLMQQVKYYVSPVNVKYNEAYVLVKNNSESVLKASSIFSEYYNNKFVGCSSMPITLNPGEESIVKIKSDRNRIVHYLWKELNALEPLVEKREVVR